VTLLDGGREIRWGICGPGKIAQRFIAATAAVRDHRVVAVCGRDRERAAAYAARHGITASFTDVQEMVERAGLDAVYVATPHSAHRDASIAALEAGAAVLCEKPMAVNTLQVAEMIAAAAAADRFLMEAMWTRFLPIYDTVRGWLANGRVGDLQLIEASFGFAAPFDPRSRLFALDLAGGALLDVGVYPLTLARWLFGSEPEGIEARAEIGDSGVDEHVTLRLDFPGGGVARLSCALNAPLANAARLVGVEGHIEIPLFWRAQKATLTRGPDVELAEAAHLANGFEYQIAEVGRCLAAGQLQSSTMPWNESAAMAELCDRIRAIIGVRYPEDL